MDIAILSARNMVSEIVKFSQLGLFNGVDEDALVKFLVCVVCTPPHKSLSIFEPNHPPANSSWTPWLVFA